MELQQAYYEQRFENAFLRSKGNEFQLFFERLMGLAFKADFMACRPWGNRGDRKNDGFLKSERRLFQVYAPNEMTESQAIKKIREDFEGAREFWGKHFDYWVFVHNSTEGLPPHVQKLMLDFENQNVGVKLEPWCLEEFKVVFRRLSLDDIASWFGPPLSVEVQARLGFQDLQVVLEALAVPRTSNRSSPKVIPPGKIEANDLSEAVTTLILAGLKKAPLVFDFLESWHDVTLGERLAVAFRERYNELRGTMHPNRVFSELQRWVGGDERGSPGHELAVITVLAYYFERCDIFEEPRSNGE